MKAFNAILKNELILLTRNIDTLFFGTFMPIGIFIMVGLIMGDKPAFEGASYTFMQQFFPAVASIVICATGLMGLPLVLSDYRDKKILKRYQATPVSPFLLLFVQVVLNLVISFITVLILWIIAKIFFGYVMLGSAMWFLISFFLVLVAMYGIGMVIASISKNVKTSNLLCTLIYFPMLFLSGATIPYEIMPEFLQKIVNFLPLTQGIKLLKEISLNLGGSDDLGTIFLMVGIGVISILISIQFFRWE